LVPDGHVTDLSCACHKDEDVTYYFAPLYAGFSFVVSRLSRTVRLGAVEVAHERDNVEHWGVNGFGQ
jgi:hypothetical protein